MSVLTRITGDGLTEDSIEMVPSHVSEFVMMQRMLEADQMAPLEERYGTMRGWLKVKSGTCKDFQTAKVPVRASDDIIRRAKKMR